MARQLVRIPRLRPRHEYPRKTLQIEFRDSATLLLRHLVGDAIRAYRNGALSYESLETIPVLETDHARVSREDPLFAGLASEYMEEEPTAMTSIPVTAGVHVAPSLGMIVMQVRSTRSPRDEETRFATITTRMLARGFYDYSQERSIITPMMLLDELLLEPLALVSGNALLMR